MPPVTETVFDANGRVSLVKSGGLVIAQPTYDTSTGAVTAVSYPSGTGNTGNGTTGSFGFDSRGRAGSVSWSGPGSTLLTSNGVTRSLGGRIVDQTVDGVDQSAGADAFAYDGAGRLVSFRSSAGLAEYVLGTQAAGCAGTGAIASGKNSNRTDRKVNGVVVASSCYDWADRLVSTTETGLAGTVAYDAHGNMVSVAGETRSYDMTDRHVQTSKGSGATLNQVVYTRDVFDRVVRRVETVNGVVTSTVKYGFTGGGDSQSFVLSDSGNTITERSLGLPGGVNVTFRTGGQVWSYPSLHGDVAAVANASGVKQGATTVWDPWGNLVTGVLPDNSASNWDYGWHGQQTRPLDHSPGLTATIEMGARQYLPQLGRFIETDPIEGGTPNNYTYVDDPVNDRDLTGMNGKGACPPGWFRPTRGGPCKEPSPPALGRGGLDGRECVKSKRCFLPSWKPWKAGNPCMFGSNKSGRCRGAKNTKFVIKTTVVAGGAGCAAGAAGAVVTGGILAGPACAAGAGIAGGTAAVGALIDIAWDAVIGD